MVVDGFHRSNQDIEGESGIEISDSEDESDVETPDDMELPLEFNGRDD